MKRTYIWSILVLLLFGFSSAHAQPVYDVFIDDEDGVERLGELEFPAGVQFQRPAGPNKDCTTTGETGFPDCQTVVFRPDPVLFAGINDSDTDLTQPLTDDFVFWFIGAPSGTLDFILAGFVHDFGSVITSGEGDFQFVELYFDNRFEPSPFDVCATARTELLGFEECFAGEDDRLLATAEFRLKVAHTPVPTLTSLAQLALVLLIAGLGILGIRNRSIKAA